MTDTKGTPRGKAADKAKAAEAPAEAGATDHQSFGDAIPEFAEAEAGADAAERAAATEEVQRLTADAGKAPVNGIQAMFNVDLDVKVVLGECRMPISQLLKLTRGSVIDLDQRIGEPVDLVVNDRLVARGDLVKLPGDRIGVSLSEIIRDHASDF